MQAQPTSAGVYTQFSGLAEMKHLAKQDPENALRQVAKQFEGVFLQMMLKSMRDASFGNPLFDNDNSDLYRDMFDKQIALNMSEQKGIGLAEALVRQLHAYVPANSDLQRETAVPNALPARPTQAQLLPLAESGRQAVAASDRSSSPQQFESPREFVRHLWPHAQEAAGELGVDPGILIAQAALETGWGQAINRDSSGNSSYNLFNIKADRRWDGPAVTVNTLEYRDGMAQREVARFRAYGSFAESFNDYVDFLKSNHRYRTALDSTDTSEFVKGLHAAGYATDPRYADKVLNIFERDSFRVDLNEVQDEARA